jgi:choline dehydrogenase-like flavoprotein
MLKKLNGMLLTISDKLNIKMPITDEWLWSAAHHSGTVPIGNTADDLIDRDLKLNFCDNIFVCDGSVIQEHSYANTGLTIGQLSMRLSERVLK